MRLNEFVNDSKMDWETIETAVNGIQYRLMYSDYLMKYGVYPTMGEISIEDHTEAFISISTMMDQRGYEFDMGVFTNRS
ncbi:hypothetical protein CL653_03470 [bacterium]|nr:hypothetical protein [bacterium]|tara:strand:+ start:607 stop:843 length:237 start_codon:yes stop_codon:yes gene_type:complete